MLPSMKNPSIRPAAQSRGSALLIVLAFLLLLTTLTVAFLSRATFERLLSNASFSQGKVDLAGQGAVSAIIGDLQLEIAAGSNVGAGTTIPAVASGYYYPNSPATVIPAIVGFTPAAGLEDLLKISYPSAFYSGSNYNTGTHPAPNRASSIATTTTSLNNRSVTAVRWNKPLLLAPTSTSNFAPISSNFVVPDWIYVARDGSNPTTWDSSYKYLPSVPPTTAPVTGTAGYDSVTQRYAYAIYDEGSTLDMNVAGSPSNVVSGALTYSATQPYKNMLAYADLTQLPYLSTNPQTVAGGSSTTLTAAQQQVFINAIVGWRNFASAGLTSSNYFPNTYSSLTTTPAPTAFDQNMIFNPGGFLTALGYNANGLSSVSTSKAGLVVGPPNPSPVGAPNQSDNTFASRQKLLQFFLQGLGQNSTFTGNVPLATLVNVLPYLSTFSRDISQPSYAPSPAKVTNAPILTEANGGNDVGGNTYTSAGYNDPILNPAFLNVTVTSAFTRNDGTTAVVGEPLVKKRFALNRLAWLTYLGPITSTTSPRTGTSLTAPSSSTTGSDYDIYLLENNYSLPQSFLAQGTAANIYKYFGLSWIKDTRTDVNGNYMDMNGGNTYKWVYNHTQANPAVGTTTSPIASLPAHPGSRNASGTAPYTTIYTLSQVAAAGRDPDFVELLKAAVCAGSIGKASFTGTAGTPAAYQNGLDVSVDTQIIQMAANIIAQYKTDAYAPLILFDDGNWSMAMEYRGVEDLPYFFRMRSLVFPLVDSTPSMSYAPATNFLNSPGIAGDDYDPTQPGNTALSNSGIGAAFNAVEIWNPHSWNPSATAAALTNLRPTSFRIIAVGGPPTIAAPPASSDPNTITMQADTRLNAPGFDYEASGISSTVPGDVRHAVSFTPSNSGLCFNIPQSTLGLALFREPTLLIKPGIPTGSNLHFAGDPNGAGAGTEGTNQVITDASTYSFSSYKVADPVSGYLGIKAGMVAGTQITNYDYPSGYTNNNLYLGTYMGLFPLKWSGLDTYYNKTYVFNADCSVTSDSSGVNPPNLTYRLQYLDPNSSDPNNSTNWITYDEKYIGVTIGNRGLAFYNQNGSPTYLNLVKIMVETKQDGFNNLYLDPRTSRFGAYSNNYSYAGFAGDAMPGWSQTTSGGSALPGAKQNATWGVRLDETNATLSYIQNFSAGLPGWYVSSGVAFYPGLTCQNNPEMNYTLPGSSPAIPVIQFFGDADGIVRRGMSGYVQSTSSQPAVTPSGSASGIAEVVSMDYSQSPPVQVNSGMEAPSRPIILNRPFRSVADLGYVFSGTPWRNLDMMTPESGGGALLDVFCINDTNDPSGLVAGKVNLNTRQAPVLQAILAGAYKSEFSPTTTMIASTGTSPVAAANVIANALVTRTTDTTDVASGSGPFTNISELVGKYLSNVNTSVTMSPQTFDGGQTYVGFSGTQSPPTTGTIPSTPANLSSILYSDSSSSGLPNNYDSANVERYREATIRALSNTTTTRVWNLMIDVIAQTGRFPSSASSLANFNVEGERRYWVHVAIDRYTGKVLDEQVEEVKE